MNWFCKVPGKIYFLPTIHNPKLHISQCLFLFLLICSKCKLGPNLVLFVWGANLNWIFCGDFRLSDLPLPSSWHFLIHEQKCVCFWIPSTHHVRSWLCIFDTHVPYSFSFSFLDFFCRNEIWTQGLTLARQEFYHLSHSASSYASHF
jgi:hypothetical protein